MFDQFVASRTLYLKNYTDDPFEQECRKLKGNVHKTASQKISEFGDKITDAKVNMVAKFKDIEIIRSNDIKTSTNEIFKQANTNIKNLRGFINRQIKSNVIPGIMNIGKLSQSETNFNAENYLTSSISSTDINEIERQYATMGKRQSVINFKPKQDLFLEANRPDRPPPPIPLPYSKHIEAKSLQTDHSGQSISDALTPPLPHKRTKSLHNDVRQEVNLISFDGPAQTNLFFVPLTQQKQQQQQFAPQPLPRTFTNPHTQSNYGSTTTSTKTTTGADTDLLLIKPTTETNLDDLIPYKVI